jgi:hypothetical protein
MALYLPIVAVLLLGTGLVSGVASLLAAIATVVIVLLLAVRYGGTMSRFIGGNDETILLTVFGLLLLVAGLAQQLQVSAGVPVGYCRFRPRGGTYAHAAQPAARPLCRNLLPLFWPADGRQRTAGCTAAGCRPRFGYCGDQGCHGLVCGRPSRRGDARSTARGNGVDAPRRIFHRDCRAGRRRRCDCAARPPDGSLCPAHGRLRFGARAIGRACMAICSEPPSAAATGQHERVTAAERPIRGH